MYSHDLCINCPLYFTISYLYLSKIQSGWEMYPYSFHLVFSYAYILSIQNKMAQGIGLRLIWE